MEQNTKPRYSSTPFPQVAAITSANKGTQIASVGVANITWQASTAVENAPLLINLVKVTFDGGTTPVGVLPGQIATFVGTTNITNKGSYRIIMKDSTTITINNKNRTSATGDETGSSGTVTIYSPQKVTIFDSGTENVFIEALNICTSSPFDTLVQFYKEQTSPASSTPFLELLVPALTGLQGRPPINLLSLISFPSQKLSGGISFPPGWKITASAVVEADYSIDFIPEAGSYGVIS